MFIIKLLLKFIQVLNSGAQPWQIASGFALGAVIGLTPLLSLHNLILLILILLIRINLTSALVSFGIFSGISALTGEISNSVGYFLLDIEGLAFLWRFLSETAVFALFSFNNTLVLGSFCIAMAAAAVLFFMTIKFVPYYRNTLNDRVEKWKIAKYLKKTKIVKLFKAAARMR